MLPSKSTSHIIGGRVCKLLGAGPTLAVPCIGAAAQAALSTIEIAQTVKKNGEHFVAIGKTCCCITATIIERAQDPNRGPNDTILRQEAKQLLKEMKFFLKCVKKHRKLPWWKRIFNHCGDEYDIQKCRRRLQKARELFALGSDVELYGLDAAPSGQMKEVPNPPQIEPSLSNPSTLNEVNLPKSPQHLQPPQHLLPSVMYNHVQGSVSNTISDSSCNVSGDGNNINFTSTC